MQTANSILMIRPARFGFNAETATSNSFQQALALSEDEIQTKVLEEFDGFVAKLRAHGVEVIALTDTAEPIKPDAIFPNNWVSFHADGRVFIYPMCTPNRRMERRKDIIAQLGETFEFTDIIDLTPFENDGRILEGTGSMVIDHIHKIIYACLSPRTEKTLLQEFAQFIGYRLVSFTSLDANGGEIYHTNVVMCMGVGFCVICLESIRDEAERKAVIASFYETGTEIIAISLEQMNQFAGNMLQVRNHADKTYLVMSQSAFDALSEAQRHALSAFTELLPVSIPTIETIGGGSARCMMAEIFCKKK